VSTAAICRIDDYTLQSRSFPDIPGSRASDGGAESALRRLRGGRISTKDTMRET
jgi:hypothetical protein